MPWERTKSLFAMPAVVIDGGCALSIAGCGFLLGRFGTDEAARHTSPAFCFWFLSLIGLLHALFTALQFFRSKSFSEHQASKGNTGFLTRVAPIILLLLIPAIWLFCTGCALYRYSQ